MPRQPETVDPYATPPMKHDKSGPTVRIAVIALILAAGAWGFMAFNNASQQTAAIAPPQQLADASDVQNLQPAPMPQAAPAPAERSMPAPRTAPRRAAAPEPTPAPTNNFESAPPVATPLPPETGAPAPPTTP